MEKIRCLVCSEHFNDIACVDFQRQKVAKEIFKQIENNLFDEHDFTQGEERVWFSFKDYEIIKARFLQDNTKGDDKIEK